MPKEVNDLGLPARLYVQALCWSYGLPKSSYQCGATKIFFRAGKVAILDNLDKITPEQHVHLTARVHTWTVRRKWRIGAAKARPTPNQTVPRPLRAPALNAISEFLVTLLRR